jgi:hypothetical protein
MSDPDASRAKRFAKPPHEGSKRGGGDMKLTSGLGTLAAGLLATGAVLGLCSLGAIATAAAAPGGLPYIPNHHWAGLVMSDSAQPSLHGSVASWIVPTVVCSKAENSNSAAWTGIGGYTSLTKTTAESLYKDGTNSDCSNGTPTYYAWDQQYGAPNIFQTSRPKLFKSPSFPTSYTERLLSHAIKPGDVISASVIDRGPQIHWSMTDTRSGRRRWTARGRWFAHLQHKHTAECVIEAPLLASHNGSVAPLSDFGQVQFSTCDAMDQSGKLWNMTGQMLPVNWTLNLLAFESSSAVQAAPVFPQGAPPSVIWISAKPMLPATNGSTQTAQQLQALLTKTGLWAQVVSSPCSDVQVYGADFLAGAADIVLSQPCGNPELFGRYFKIRSYMDRAFSDECDGCTGIVTYSPLPSYGDRSFQSFHLVGGALVPDAPVPTVPVPTTTTAVPVATTTTTVPTEVPTLGLNWEGSGGGYGSVRPTLVSNGGDPTGVVSSITWQSWGGSQAVGTGTSDYVAPGQTVADGSQQTVTIVAYNLGTCDGQSAYQDVEWYFPGQGQTFDPSQGLTACQFGYVNSP